MAWKIMSLFAADVVLLGKSTPTNAKEKTSNVLLAGCIGLWLSSMDPRSAYLGRESLTKKRLLFLSLTASQSCQGIGHVGI